MFFRQISVSFNFSSLKSSKICCLLLSCHENIKLIVSMAKPENLLIREDILLTVHFSMIWVSLTASVYAMWGPVIGRLEKWLGNPATW